MSDVTNFVSIVSKLDGKITVRDNKGHCVNAKSLMGMIYSMEFDELILESDNDIYSKVEKYIKL